MKNNFKITHDQIEEIIEVANEEAGEYDCAEGVICDAAEKVLGDDYNYKLITLEDKFQYSPHRWYIPVEDIFGIGGYYICGSWNKPSTEMQEGQPTDLTFYEVEPYQKVVTKYEMK